MKKISKITIFILAVLFLASCTPVKPLYYWGNYSDAYYKYIKKADEKATERYKASLNTIFEQSKKLEIKVPPGINAEYGYFLLKQGNKEDARKYFNMELETYPESKIFMTRVIETLK
jgi:hypothetical protein